MLNYAVSVLSYNHPELTAKCLRSLLGFVPAENIFLTHNGSLLKHINDLKTQFPDINHTIILENKGYSAGANIALKTVFNSFSTVLFLTNDTEVVTLPITTTKSFSSVKLLRRNSTEIDSVMGALNPRTGKLKHLKNLSDHKPSDITYIPGTAFWINRNNFLKLNGFDERFHTYWEDVDLSLRAHQLSIPLEYDETTILKHKIGKTCHKDRFYTYELFQRNRGRCLTKNNLTSFKFYINYIPDLIKYSRSDFKKAYSIFKNHRLSPDTNQQPVESKIK